MSGPQTFPSNKPIIRTEHLSKSFGEIKANVDISLQINSGFVHSILGENGAGKSTLLNQLYGLYQPDFGRIFVGEKEARFSSPADALESGIYLVAQNFNLVLPFTVRENIEVLHKVREKLRNSSHTIDNRISEISKMTDLSIDLDSRVKDLSMGERQKVEIMRGLATGAGILMLDEPSSNLTPMESKNLFVFLRKLVEQGYTVVVTTHKLSEVMKHCDYVSVLRRGRVVSTREVAKSTREELTMDILGSALEINGVRDGAQSNDQTLILKLEGISYHSNVRSRSLSDIEIIVSAGEVYGVGGVAGNGQVELGLIAAGKLRPSSGKIIICGKDLTNQSIKQFIDAGLAFVPDEGPATGIIPNMTVAENLCLLEYRKMYSKFGFVEPKQMSGLSERLIKEYDIRPPDPNHMAKLLSGGNLQKLILARELSIDGNVLVAMNPTRGLDIRTTEMIRNAMLQQRNKGRAVLLISEDLEELMTLSDRLAIMFEGKIVGSWTRGEIKELGPNALDTIGRRIIGETG